MVGATGWQPFSGHTMHRYPTFPGPDNQTIEKHKYLANVPNFKLMWQKEKLCRGSYKYIMEWEGSNGNGLLGLPSNHSKV